MKKQYIWYACYGSNINKERFLYYIKGGKCTLNNSDYDGCNDKTEPVEDRPINIPHRLYFAERSKSWEYGGVAFIDPQRDENEATLGRAYLITQDQFNGIKDQEGPWYPLEVVIGEMDRIPIKTFTSAKIRLINRPSPKYIQCIADGLKQVYPNMDNQQVQDYLTKHSRS